MISTDLLSIFFSAVILIIAVPIAIYSIGYMQEYRGKYSLSYFACMLLIFVASMLGVVFSGDAVSFMVFWEIMSVASFFLVIYEFRNKETLKAGVMYFIMTHISGLFLLVMFSVIFRYTGGLEFSKIAYASTGFSVPLKTVIFILALLGFGAKAGIIPLHPWLPKAHPAAASNISALMSGVMLKVALYGFIRLVFVLLGGSTLNFGLATMVLGTLTAVYSIIHALFQDDIKKLLAYSSAENIGIITAVLGLSMIFAARSLMGLSMLALTAALFHILNHAVFKSLLFTSAGSVLYATGTRNMNELGGLYGKMKFATVCAFIGTAAISAIPPLNGFASELLVFKSFIVASYSINSLVLVISVVTCGILLAATSGGAVYASVKSFGIAYLGAPRSSKAVETHKIPASMNWGLGILSLYSIVLGIFSPFAIQLLSKVSAYTLNAGKYWGPNEAKLAINYDIVLTAFVITAVTLAVAFVSRQLNKAKVTGINDTWGCGFNAPQPYMQYSGSGYAQPMSRIVKHFAGYRKEVKQKATISIKHRTVDIIEKYLFEPSIKLVYSAAELVSKIHYDRIQLYVSYIFISLIVTIILVIKFI